MPSFLPALPHSPITEVFRDVYFVTGGFSVAPGLSITRNMTIVRQGAELVLINSVRLSEEGETALERLGKVAHVLRIGAFHGADDPYYAQRYHPTIWCPPGTETPMDLPTSELRPGHGPLSGAQVFAFEKSRLPEVAILLERDGGILVTCDCYQNWTTFEGCSLLGRWMMRAMGFGPTLIGGPWAKRMGPDVRMDFDRLLALEWRHLVPGHGTVLRDRAKEALPDAIRRRYG